MSSSTPLLTATDIDELNPGTPEVDAYKQILLWTREYLSQPHAELGDPGRSVCPFIPGALKRDTLWFHVEVADDSTATKDLIQRVGAYRETFLKMLPEAGREVFFKAIVLIFPGITEAAAPKLIDEIQLALKPGFVRDALMVGEFHPQNQTPGMRNPHFRPLRSPIPLLAIRHMVETDVPFLASAHGYSPRQKLEFIRAYLKAYQRLVPESRTSSLVQIAEALEALTGQILEER